MALFRYLHPIDSAIDPQGPLFQAISRVMISKVNQEVKKVEMQMKNEAYMYMYLSLTVEGMQATKYTVAPAKF